MAAISRELFERLVQSADGSAVKIEMTAGMPTWEAMPGRRHQRINLAVVNSVRRAPKGKGECGYRALIDVYIRFPDGSFRSPDVAIYCEEPPDVVGALDVLPVAVVEIVSAGYEAKDRIGLPFYLE